MPLPTSGAISLSNIKNEFNPSDTGDMSISSYYKGSFSVGFLQDLKITSNSELKPHICFSNDLIPNSPSAIDFSDYRGSAQYQYTSRTDTLGNTSFVGQNSFYDTGITTPYTAGNGGIVNQWRRDSWIIFQLPYINTRIRIEATLTSGGRYDEDSLYDEPDWAPAGYPSYRLRNMSTGVIHGSREADLSVQAYEQTQTVFPLISTPRYDLNNYLAHSYSLDIACAGRSDPTIGSPYMRANFFISFAQD